MPTPFHRYDDVHTTNGGENAPNCLIIVHIFCLAGVCDTVRIEGFVREEDAWVELASGPVQCTGDTERHELPMVRPLDRQELAVRAVFICDSEEEAGEEQRIFAVYQEQLHPELSHGH